MKRSLLMSVGVALAVAACTGQSGPSTTSILGETTTTTIASTTTTVASTACDDSGLDSASKTRASLTGVSAIRASTTSEMHLFSNDIVALVDRVEIFGEDCRDFVATVVRVLFMADSSVHDLNIPGGVTLPEVAVGDRVSGRIFPAYVSGDQMVIVGHHGPPSVVDWDWAVTAFPVQSDGSLAVPDAFPGTREGFDRLLSDIESGIVCGYEASSRAEILGALVAEARHQHDYDRGVTSNRPDTVLKDSYNGIGTDQEC